MKSAWGCLLALAAIACALNPAPVPIEGTRVEVAALAGEWLGEYRSIETGRTGSVMFRLDAGRDTAFGDVVMVSAREAAVVHHDAIPPIAMTHPAQQVLTIRFVRVAGNTVVGTIDPYPSPDCECQLLTTFRGELLGNRIEGSFLVHHSGHEMTAQKGTWWVSRSVKPGKP